jgi:hypothetical protein
MKGHDHPARVDARRTSRQEAEREAARAGTVSAVPSTAEQPSGRAGMLALQRSIGNAAVARLLARGRSLPRKARVGSAQPRLQRMSVAGTAVASSVSGETRTKHVVASAGQQAAADGGYGDRTFVRSDNVLTAAVDADPHSFAAGAARSGRQDVQAQVTIDQWQKTTRTPAGLAAGQPCTQTITNTASTCEIGAVKTGTGAISITHFKKV